MVSIERRQRKCGRHSHQWLWMLLAVGVVGLVVVATRGGINIGAVHIHIALLP